MSLRIERNQAVGEQTVDLVTFDDMQWGRNTVRRGVFDVPVPTNTSDHSCVVVGHVRWSTAYKRWELSGYQVFRPQLCIDALNVAAIREYTNGSLLDPDTILGFTSSLDDALVMARPVHVSRRQLWAFQWVTGGFNQVTASSYQEALEAIDAKFSRNGIRNSTWNSDAVTQLAPVDDEDAYWRSIEQVD